MRWTLRSPALLMVTWTVLGLGIAPDYSFSAEPQTPAAAPASATVAAPTKRVLIVSFDGFRPDIALRANMPNLRKVMSEGSFTFWAQTTDVAITLPSHVSMLTGNPPEVHGVTWNDDLTPAKRPKVATLFELAKQAGYSTAMASGKVKFHALAKAGGLDWSSVPEKGKFSDEQVAEIASRFIKEHQPQVLFVHFPEHDAVGHSKGWGSVESIRAAESADVALGQVLQALEDAKLRQQTLIILTADHGGAGKSHGGTDPRSRHIPWIIAGPGVRPNYDLTLDSKLTVKVEDTFATALTYLGVSLPNPCAGKFVKEAFEKSSAKTETKPEAKAGAKED